MPDVRHPAGRGRRALVSESALVAFLQRVESRCAPPAGWPARTIRLGVDELAAMTPRWTEAIERQAAGLSKQARRAVEALPSGCLYDGLQDRTARLAALMCEVFRHPHVSKNSGWLDLRTLQRRLAAAISAEGPLRLVIAWGQPKRDAAGLKTAGPFADLADLYSIARLAIVARAVSLSARGRPVTITVLGGGTRFQEALFTDPAVIPLYDAQRQRIADRLSGPGAMSFVDYVERLGDAVAEDRRRRYQVTLRSVADESVATAFSTVLVNVDWPCVFDLAAGATATGDLPRLPEVVRAWLEPRSPADRRRLLQAALSSILSPRCQRQWEELLDDRECVLERAVAFVRTVAWESTRRYVALQAVDASREDGAAADGADATVRLTVHEKHDRPDVPAIFLLGPSGGNLLSQHVAVRISSDGSSHFESVAEVQERAAVPVMVDPGGPAEIFDWLATAGQPLCFMDPDVDRPRELLAALLDR